VNPSGSCLAAAPASCGRRRGCRCSQAAKVLLESARRDPRPAASLTPREREVLVLVAQGLANKNIARRLGISERTVKSHLTSVFQAIGVVDRTQAALWAREHLDPQDRR
jgi:DNA-binding NarL/FixJ family response regulator